MDIRQTHYKLFGLPECFAVDAEALQQAYRALQNQVHPDRYAGAGAAERRVALQWATHVNGAFQTLREPLARAVYLCGLRGVDAAAAVAMPTDFLMVQMEAREALEDARALADVDALEQLSQHGRGLRRDLIATITAQLDEQGNTEAAATSARKLMFLEKFGDEVNAALESTEV